jgi:4'-phosphopantetheinyl transferase
MSEVIYWRSARGSLDLDVGDLHLWRIRTDDRGLDLDEGLSLLGERQQARAGRMRHAAYRERYVRSHAGLRLILSRYLDLAPRAIAFEHGPAGKPFVTASALSFNLTTTGDLALVGLCTGPASELGVDCEWIRPRVDHQGVAERMFEPDALGRLAAVPETERLDSFYRAWTALEADAKSDGRGLFRPRATGAPRPAIAHCLPETGYIAAVARVRLPPIEQWLTFDLDSH